MANDHDVWRSIRRLVVESLAIVVVAGLLALGVNALRAQPLDLVATLPYEIFAPCRDSEVRVEATAARGLDDPTILLVDARPTELFVRGHARGAINVPYSPLFGAAPGDLDRLKASAEGAKEIVVYGELVDPAAPAGSGPVDLAKPLTEQLVESGFTRARHLPGCLPAVNKLGRPTVQGSEETR